MTVYEKAYAKINLYLDVTGRRDDGFHDILSVMHSVSLCDELALTAEDSDIIDITITSDDKSLEVDKNNLIYKAALKYLSYFDISAKICVDLIKRIPIGAGLGGGSSDAAATLRAMNRIFGLASKDQLLEIAEGIGSDVPFCLIGGCAICKGKGEKITPFKVDFCKNVVIAIGESRVSTPKAYSLLDEKYGDFKSYVQQNKCFEMRCIPVYNIFESVIDLDDVINIKNIMSNSEAEYTLMSGSGPSVFGLFKRPYAASRAMEALEKAGFTAFQCELI